jgi:hypothetical protein
MSRGRARRPAPAGSVRAAAAAIQALLLVVAAALQSVAYAAAAGEEQEPAAAVDYGAALSKSLLYFEAQRSGRLPHNQRVPWRGHSGLTDGLQQGVDLVGGYYDAGDHVKFGLPMAFTVTMLSWGAIEFGDDVAAAGEWGHALEAIKWGTDYFVKAHTEPFVYWAEVTYLRYCLLLASTCRCRGCYCFAIFKLATPARLLVLYCYAIWLRHRHFDARSHGWIGRGDESSKGKAREASTCS